VDVHLLRISNDGGLNATGAGVQNKFQNSRLQQQETPETFFPIPTKTK
jgi:hypothetical protein